MTAGRTWIRECYTPHDMRGHELRRLVVQKKTRFQKVVLADSYSFGRCLILEKEIQSAQRDEFIYHEALVHPALVLHRAPSKILVLGGGEGATVREILRHRRVQSVSMVDIDGDVVGFCKKYLRSWHQGSFDHPKTQLVIDDAGRFVAHTRETFDVIYSDLPTPEGPREPIAALYGQRFYTQVRRCLKADGYFVVQSGSGHWFQSAFVQQLHRRLSGLFRVVRPYYAFVPSFDEPWAFLIAGPRDPRTLVATWIDRKLGTLHRSLRFYDGETHEGMFRIPKYLRNS